MEKKITLSKQSSDDELKRYFKEVRKLQLSQEKFPVDFDTVWPLVFKRKADAVKALRGEMVKDIDYQILRQDTENYKSHTPGRPIERYSLSVSCLEFFIARRVNAVFEIYRKVFHRAMDTVENKLTEFQGRRLPQSFSEACIMLGEAEQKLEKQQLKVEFYDTVTPSDDDLTLEKAAKIIEKKGYGRNNLYEFLREKKIFGKNNRPSQKFIESRHFRYKMNLHKGCVSYTSYVTPKGIDYIIRRLKKSK